MPYDGYGGDEGFPHDGKQGRYRCIAGLWRDILTRKPDGRERPVFKSIEQVIAYKHDNIVGRFSCKGFDTFGPFKLNGGGSRDIRMRKILLRQWSFTTD